MALRGRGPLDDFGKLILNVSSYSYNTPNELTTDSAATFTYDENGNTLTTDKANTQTLPKNTMTRMIDLAALWKNKEFKSALAAVDDLLKSSHECPYLLRRRGMLILLQEDDSWPSLEEAEACLLRAHDLAPNNLDTLEELVHFYAVIIPNPDKARHYARMFEESIAEKLHRIQEVLE